MNNANKHKSYEWYLQFDEITCLVTGGEACPSYVNEENKGAWRRYLNRLIRKHFWSEVTRSPEFLEICQVINEEKMDRVRWDEREKKMCEVAHDRRQMKRPKINFVRRGLEVDYEYARYFMQEATNYLHEAWKEIKDTGCYKYYGVPMKEF